MLTRTGSAHAARTPTDAIGPVTDAARTVTSRNAPMPRSTTAPRSTGASTVHRTAAALVALAMMLLGLGTTLSARADGGHATPASTPAPTSIGDCLGSGRVWLFVSYQDAVVSNQCVGNPSSGTEALGVGGVSVRQGKGGLICSLADTPAGCTTGNRDYWPYFHATDATGWASYDYSQLGADSFQPTAGSIEAWCYTRDADSDQSHCTPPALRVTRADGSVANPQGATPAVTTLASVSPGGQSPVATIAAGGLVVAMIGVAVVVRRRRGKPARARRRTS